jgi:hypothetical protein
MQGKCRSYALTQQNWSVRCHNALGLVAARFYCHALESGQQFLTVKEIFLAPFFPVFVFSDALPGDFPPGERKS